MKAARLEEKHPNGENPLLLEVGNRQKREEKEMERKMGKTGRMIKESVI